MTQLLIDRSTLEQLVRMLEQCLDDAIQVQCDLEQGYSKSLALAQMVQVELSKEALTTGRAALDNADPTGWQPIETAPKDGSFYLAFGEGGTWTQNQPNGCYPGEWHFSGSRGEWRGCVISKEATHWMPLPAAPKDTP